MEAKAFIRLPAVQFLPLISIPAEQRVLIPGIKIVSVAPTEVTNFGITSKELDIRGSRLQNRKFQTAIDLIRGGKLDLDHRISHTFPFLDAQKAFDFNDTRDPSIRKIVLTFE